MEFSYTETQQEIRAAVRKLCADFGLDYWRNCDDAGVVEHASRYASEREVFDRPIGANQGIQFPLARAHMNLQAAELMRNKAATLFDRNQPCGHETNMAKYLATEASWGGGGSHDDDLRRVRICLRVSRRTEVARGTAIPHRANLEQSRARASRAAHAQHAAILLKGPR